MLKLHTYWWGLLLAGLAIVGAVAAAASILLTSDHPPWQVATVESVNQPAGGARLLLEGEGLHDGLQAMLIPELRSVSVADSRPDLSLALSQFATDGNLAVASARDRRIITLDVTEGRSPAVQGSLKLATNSLDHKPGSIKGLVLFGTRAVVGIGTKGLALLDVADPSTPRQVDFVELPEQIYDLQASGEVVYLATHPGGLHTVTVVSDRLVLQKIPGSPAVRCVAVSRQRVVTAGPGGVLTFFEPGPRGLPVVVGRARVDEEISDLVLTEKALFVATAKHRLIEFTIGKWPQSVAVAKIDLHGRPLRLQSMETSRLLVCTLVGVGVEVIDVGLAGVPRSAGVIPMVNPPISLESRAGRLFLAGPGGMKILPAQSLHGMSTEVKPEQTLLPAAQDEFLMTFGSATFVRRHGGVQLLANGGSGTRTAGAERGEPAPFLVLPEPAGVRLHAVRGGKPTAELANRIPVPNECSKKYCDKIMQAFWQAGRVYVRSCSKVIIFGVVPSGKVTSTEEFQAADCLVDMDWLPGGFLVVAINDQGLIVLDVRTPGACRVVGEYPLARYQRSVGTVKSLLVHGDRLYVARSRLGVEVYSLANPASPLLLQRIDTPGVASNLILSGGLLLVADWKEGVFVIDVSGKRALPVGRFRLPSPARNIFCDGPSLYLENSSREILRFPAPLSLASADVVSRRLASLTIPPGTPPGRYQLALYDHKATVNYPVILQ